MIATSVLGQCFDKSKMMSNTGERIISHQEIYSFSKYELSCKFPLRIPARSTCLPPGDVFSNLQKSLHTVVYSSPAHVVSPTTQTHMLLYYFNYLSTFTQMLITLHPYYDNFSDYNLSCPFFAVIDVLISDIKAPDKICMLGNSKNKHFHLPLYLNLVSVYV